MSYLIQRMQNLAKARNRFRRGTLALLVALASAAAWAQSPPATQAGARRGAVFAEPPGTVIKSAPAPTTTVVATNARPASLTAGTNGSVLPADLSAYVPDDKYKLRVGDRVAFQILEDRDAPKSLVVADSGELDVPYIGRVAAVDKTCKQLATELKVQLEKEYYYRATVIVALDVVNRLWGRIYVWGQVKNQGPMDIAIGENLTAGKAILRAGGFGDFANKKKVKVVRAGDAEGKGKKTFELNMVEILEQGNTEKDLLLQPEDSIIVPSRLVNF